MIVSSSPDEVESDRMALLRKRDPNPPHKLFFNILNLATICSKCTYDKRSFCPHNLQNRAVWKSMKTENKLRGLMPDKYFRKEVSFFLTHIKFVYTI